MAKNNPGDILTFDWNPLIGCERYSEGCRGCWYIDGIFPWQQRLGNIPAGVQPSDSHLFEKRMSAASLKVKNGIVGIVQHGDLFYEGHDDDRIKRVLDIVDAVAPMKRKTPTYLLWTKRAERMGRILGKRYPKGLPAWLAAAVSVENKATLPRLEAFNLFSGRKVIVLEPLLEAVSLKNKLAGISWVILGSETGNRPRPLMLDWARRIRDETKAANIPFFVKQLGTSHKSQERDLDGVVWGEFPKGFEK